MDILIAMIITVLLFYLYKIDDKQEKKWFYFDYEDVECIEAEVVDVDVDVGDSASPYTAYVIKF